MLSTHKKTLQTIISTSNHYLAAVKANQPKLYSQISESFQGIESHFEVNKGHGRTEKRLVEIMPVQEQDYPDWCDISTIIRVTRQRRCRERSCEETCYYISDLEESAQSFAQRIRGYWGVENCVHYVRDVTFGEDNSRIRTGSLPNLWAITRNLAINLDREAGFTNMAQAKRLCSYGFKHILALFRTK
ncbi:ISAs1 family transposase [Gloeocapsa sp. PCC 73106]|uniref:ISAs1 family transposase n=1 Tax=Gloeocapsa sp. PCC 73106 TaxID=102232 RepID=UPI00054D5F6D|nr:ISAs1 family transposase [Gloeocapsa sp. PCC 73106]